MTARKLSLRSKLPRDLGIAHDGRPSIVEYGYYAVLFYTMLAPGWGALIPGAGGGALLVLAGFCVLRLGSRAAAVYAPLSLPLGCAFSFFIVEATVHGGSLTSGFPRIFITWVLALLIIGSLHTQRRFLDRSALVMWAMGLVTLPYLVFAVPDTEILQGRLAADRTISGDFNNPNGLGGWFGFCCLYFLVTGIETRRSGVRLASSMAAAACLYVIGLSVSRGALLGTALGATIALRRVLRRGFVPLLTFVTLAGIFYNSGVFDQVISRYTTRGAEESGRFLVWPQALQRTLTAPILGVGANNVDTYVPDARTAVSPHNSFLWFALASGIVPLLLFIACWIRAAHNSLKYADELGHGPYRLPFLVHTFVVAMVGDLGFMQPWGVVTLCIAMAPGNPGHVRRVLSPRRAGRLGQSAGLLLQGHPCPDRRRLCRHVRGHRTV